MFNFVFPQIWNFKNKYMYYEKFGKLGLRTDKPSNEFINSVIKEYNETINTFETYQENNRYRLFMEQKIDDILEGKYKQMKDVFIAGQLDIIAKTGYGVCESNDFDDYYKSIEY